jgi:hypothetical protein
MLKNIKLTRTNYVEGMKVSAADFRRTDEYVDHQLKILSLGGMGYGILAGYNESLIPSIQGSLLVIKSGAAIDRKGNIIYLPQVSSPLGEDISITRFPDHSIVYIYIKFHSFEDNLQDDRSGQRKVNHEIVSSYKIEITTNRFEGSDWIELGRVNIDYEKRNLYGQQMISEPLNPFSPRENEIDIRFAPKIVSNLININSEGKDVLAKTLSDFGLFLNSYAGLKRSFTASSAAAYAYRFKDSIFSTIATPSMVYRELRTLVDLVVQIKNEKDSVEREEFWINIVRLKELFHTNENDMQQTTIHYYQADIEFESSYFARILKHFERAAKCKVDEEIVEEAVEEKPKHKGYVQVGRSVKEEHGNDIAFEDDQTMSRIHLNITAFEGGFFIEDLSANGTYVNAERLEKGSKKFVKPSDEIIMGRRGTKLNLNDPKIQELLTL